VKKGAPDGLSEGDSSRWWNVVKSVALTASGDNLAEQNRGYGSRGDVGLPLGEPKAGIFLSLTIERDSEEYWKPGQYTQVSGGTSNDYERKNWTVEREGDGGGARSDF
jgi:hypothetical protein